MSLAKKEKKKKKKEKTFANSFRQRLAHLQGHEFPQRLEFLSESLSHLAHDVASSRNGHAAPLRFRARGGIGDS